MTADKVDWIVNACDSTSLLNSTHALLEQTLTSTRSHKCRPVGLGYRGIFGDRLFNLAFPNIKIIRQHWCYFMRRRHKRRSFFADQPYDGFCKLGRKFG